MSEHATTLKKLDRIRILAAIDLLLLVVLLFFSFSNDESGVSILGPIHGVIFLILLFFTAVGAREKRWGWLFCVTTIIPLFALLYEAKLRREIVAA